ncbi:MAG: hypothetical protein H2040_02435 [Euryhalocaulis sp.]|uniref:hypothetical protein n=1 Tax=Euryhalocaulis sp. TaxID=2744307 RepID=UPI0017D67BFE|nr:hypothetical protein [Euryhalocaulis sp.]MBA4800699.1 hypothetical protein [Euryhalocaulis sp.]
MFIGHYGPAFAAPAARRIPLWHLFIAVQLVDYGWAILSILGIEKMRIEPGFTAMSPYDLYHMPWTHSLAASLVWAGAAAALYALVLRRGWPRGLVIGAAVLSHWFLDLLVHTPDLALWPGGPKVGLGWWDSWPLGLGSELIVLAAGFALYMTVSTAKSALGRVTPFILLGVLALLEASHLFVSMPDQTVTQGAVSILIVFTVLTALAAWCDATRRYKSA